MDGPSMPAPRSGDGAKEPGAVTRRDGLRGKSFWLLLGRLPKGTRPEGRNPSLSNNSVISPAPKPQAIQRELAPPSHPLGQLAGLAITRAGRLLQKLQANPPIPRIVAFAAQQLPQPGLGLDHALAGGSLEESAGEPLDAACLSQSRLVEQPEGHLGGQLRDLGSVKGGQFV